MYSKQTNKYTKGLIHSCLLITGRLTGGPLVYPKAKGRGNTQNRSPVCHRANRIHAYRQFNIRISPDVHAFGLWEENRSPSRNPRKQGDHPRKAPDHLNQDLNPGPSCWEAIAMLPRKDSFYKQDQWSNLKYNHLLKSSSLHKQ